MSKKEFKNSLIWPLLGHLKVEKSAKIMIFAIFIQIFLSLFFRILAFFFIFKKLRIKSTLSTNSKKKFKNSLIQPRTSRSNFGKMSSKMQWNSMKFIKILARPLWLDFEGAFKKNLILEKLFWSSIHTLKMMCFPFLTLFFAIFR